MCIRDRFNRGHIYTRDEDGKLLNGYLATNRLWKKTKTAWNPVVHVNNTVSNITL